MNTNAPDIDKIIDSMTVEEMVSQVLNYNIEPKDTVEETMAVIRRTHPGGIYYGDFGNCKTWEDVEKLIAQHKDFQAVASEKNGVPVLATTDIEYGPGNFCKLFPQMPAPMAWGSANDEKLVERAGELTAMIARKLGLHFPLAPVVDLNINFQNPLVNIRAVSDDPDRVIRIAGAYMRGMQKNGYLAACLKHFPGDGADDRDQHFMTTVNRLSREEWMATYGKVYRKMIEEGAAGIMVAHISAPAFEGCEDRPNEALPGALSKELMTDLLKGELGFDGCIISDAMSMIGSVALASLDNLAVDFLVAGGDMVLFPEDRDYERILEAVRSGKLPMARLRDAVARVLRLKKAARCFEEDAVQKELAGLSFEELSAELEDVARQIADKSIKVLRNRKGVLPLPPREKAEKGRALIVTLWDGFFNSPPSGKELEGLKAEIERRGYTVDYMTNPKHKEIYRIMNDYDFIVVGVDIHCMNYSGASMRMNWNVIMTFWRGYILEHPRLVVVSFGDPYKLYDMPYLSTYVNAFGDSEPLQAAAAKVLFGEIAPRGKNPVRLEGFFEREE